MGDVYQVRRVQDNQMYAKKVYTQQNYKEENVVKFTRECEISCQIKYQCIVSFVGLSLCSQKEPA